MNLSTSQQPTQSFPVLSLSSQLAVLREMLETLDTLSSAGQRYLMAKVTELIQAHATRLFRESRPRNQRAWSDLLVHLRRESDRLLPDVSSFTRGAEGLVALLAAAA